MPGEAWCHASQHLGLPPELGVPPGVQGLPGGVGATAQGGFGRAPREARNTLAAADALASLLKSQGRLDEAEPLLREALQGRRAKLGDTHPTTLQSVQKLAGLLEAQGHLKQAESLYQEALEGRRGKLGKDHADTLASANSLADLLKSHG